MESDGEEGDGSYNRRKKLRDRWSLRIFVLCFAIVTKRTGASGGVIKESAKVLEEGTRKEVLNG